MKTYHIEVDCNGGEYVNSTVIKCSKLTKVNDKTVKADKVLIEFDEQIISITDLLTKQGK